MSAYHRVKVDALAQLAEMHTRRQREYREYLQALRARRAERQLMALAREQGEGRPLSVVGSSEGFAEPASLQGGAV